MLCRSVFVTGLWCRRRSGPGGPCRNGMDTAGSPFVVSGTFSSKMNKKRTWSFPVFISRRSKRKCINKIRKHVHNVFVALYSYYQFSKYSSDSIVFQFLLLMLFKTVQTPRLSAVTNIICNNVLNHNYSCSLKWPISK